MELIAGPVIAFLFSSFPSLYNKKRRGTSSRIFLSVPVFTQSTRHGIEPLSRKLLKEATDTEGHTDFDSLRRVPVLDQILYFWREHQSKKKLERLRDCDKFVLRGVCRASELVRPKAAISRDERPCPYGPASMWQMENPGDDLVSSSHQNHI